MEYIHALILLILLLMICVCVMPVMAEEGNTTPLNTSEIPGCINGSPNWAGQRDLSEFSRYDPPYEETEPSKDTLNPDIIIINASNLSMDENLSSGEVSLNQYGSFTVTRTHNVTPTQTNPIPPGMNPWESLRGRHPNVESNAEIMEYINTCGISSWYERRYNTTCRYVYLVPGSSCARKLVYLNKDVKEREDNDSIIWIRLIDLDEELPVEVPGPLAGLYVMYRAAQENPAIKAFIREYRPERWDVFRGNETSVQVYLIAENKTFRQLIATAEGTTITGVMVLEETDLAVNKTEALARARQQVSPTAECIDHHLRLKDRRVVWFISYLDGPVIMSIEVDAGEVPASQEKIPCFSFGSAVGSLLLLRVIHHRKGRQGS